MAKPKCFEVSEVQYAYLENLIALTKAEGHQSKTTEYWEEILLHSSFDKDKFDYICEVIDYCSTKLKRNDLTSFERKFFSKEFESEQNCLNYIEKSGLSFIENSIKKEFIECKDIKHRIQKQEDKFQDYLKKIEVLSGISMESVGV